MGKGIKKQAQPTGNDEEERLWQAGSRLLGDHSAQAFVDTMLYALRSGQEHCRL